MYKHFSHSKTLKTVRIFIVIRMFTNNISNFWTEPPFRANHLFGEPPSWGLLYRDETDDSVTRDAARAIQDCNVGIKCPTITPDTTHVLEFNLKERWDNPNRTLRKILGGTISYPSLPPLPPTHTDLNEVYSWHVCMDWSNVVVRIVHGPCQGPRACSQMGLSTFFIFM